MHKARLRAQDAGHCIDTRAQRGIHQVRIPLGALHLAVAEQLAIISSDAPPLTRSEAKVWRRSWMRTSAIPASFRVLARKRRISHTGLPTVSPGNSHGFPQGTACCRSRTMAATSCEIGTPWILRCLVVETGFNEPGVVPTQVQTVMNDQTTLTVLIGGTVALNAAIIANEAPLDRLDRQRSEGRRIDGVRPDMTETDLRSMRHMLFGAFKRGRPD